MRRLCLGVFLITIATLVLELLLGADAKAFLQR